MNRRRAWQAALVVALAALLAACANLSAPRAPATGGDERSERWRAHRDAVAALERYTLTGRVAVQRGDEGGGAKLRWRQTGADSDLRIMAPLGQGTFKLVGNAGGVTLSAPDGKQYAAASFEALMAAHVGWSFPVDGARYWVRGLPDPRLPEDQLVLDEQGRLTDLAQAGWRISVLEYRDHGGLALPARLFLNAGDLKIRLAIDGWSLPAP